MKNKMVVCKTPWRKGSASDSRSEGLRVRMTSWSKQLFTYRSHDGANANLLNLIHINLGHLGANKTQNVICT